jgi:hypothetical protein
MNESENVENINKGDLIALIKEWKQIDDEIKSIQKEVKKRRDRKKLLSDKLIKIMRTNEIDSFDINNGKLLYTQSKLKESINRPYLLGIISKYFEDDDTVDIGGVADYILENRAIKLKEGIRCKLDKK